MKPSIGRILHFKVTAEIAEKINKRREDAVSSQIAKGNTGAQVHYGNTVKEGDILPLLVTRVISDTVVNGQLFLDGNDTYWVTSTDSWTWPPRV